MALSLAKAAFTQKSMGHSTILSWLKPWPPRIPGQVHSQDLMEIPEFYRHILLAHSDIYLSPRFLSLACGEAAL